VTELRGEPGAGGKRFAIAASRFNEVVVERLVEGALKGFANHGAGESDVDLAWVPGAFELPLAARRLAASGEYAAVVCLGAVIRGETAHFDYVAEAAERGIMQATLETGVPILFGVLTTQTMEQAMDRAGGAHGNKGWDMAVAAIEMASLMDKLPGAGS
jgi:6,7-dimethyl-8-ribityllumazine synthase